MVTSPQVNHFPTLPRFPLQQVEDLEHWYQHALDSREQLDEERQRRAQAEAGRKAAEAAAEERLQQCMAAQAHAQRLQEQVHSLMAADGNTVSPSQGLSWKAILLPY